MSSSTTQARVSRRQTRAIESVPSSTTSRFHLPQTDVARTTPKEHDVLFDPQTQSHALVLDASETDSYIRFWLNGPRAGQKELIDSSLLDYQVEYRGAEIIVSGVQTPLDAWWLFDAPESEISTTKNDHRRPISTSNLTLVRDRKRTEVNEFLNHSLVDHDLGGIPGWKACFTAMYAGKRVATAVLSRPTSKQLDQNSVIQLSRYAAHPHRPPNTATWLLARSRDWAELEGYDELRTYAGVSDNKGTIYQAAGFRLDAVEEAKGDNWQSRPGRKSWDDYTRRRYVYSLEAVSRPTPPHENTTQTELNQNFSDMNQRKTDDPLIARLDQHPQWAAKFQSQHASADIDFASMDAIFGMLTRDRLSAVIPVTTDLSNKTARIHAITIAPESLRYPTNDLSRVCSRIQRWATLEGCSQTVCEPTTDFEQQVCDHIQLPT